MKITHFHRKSIIVVNMSARYRLILRGTFFDRTFTSPDLLIKRCFLKPSGILLTVSTRSVVESACRTPLPSLTSVEDSLSSSKQPRASLEFTRRSFEFAQFMFYTRIKILPELERNINFSEGLELHLYQNP